MTVFMQPVIDLIKAYARIIRFVIAGGTGAVVNLTALYLLVEYGHLNPVVGSIGSFVCAFFVSFGLQKLWTYKNYDKQTAGKQMTVYLGIQLFNLALNTGIMYLFVHHTPIHYIVAQIITSGLIAVESFFLYKHIVFRDTNIAPEAA